MNHKYQVRQEIRPKQLLEMSEKQIAQHWTLYEGYVKNVNLLNEKIADFLEKKDFGPEFAELKRRLGFEYNGMILHEHYFGILKSGQKPLGDSAELTKMFKKSFGGYSNWLEEFSAMGKMRGIGWVILYYNPSAQILTNHWIDMHEDGHPAGFIPIIVMDVWEHAYMVDAGVEGRPAYVNAFIKNINWLKAEQIIGNARGLTNIPALH